jgi:predicted transcriptional regulator
MTTMPDSVPHEADEDPFDVVDEEHERLQDDLAEADVKAGRVVPHEKVVEWLKTWGTAERKPAPFSWRK